ncbi:MAG: GNAT family N-acetyltransferase [Myxococcota bacterium]
MCKCTLDDAPFVLELLRDPAYIRFIGDRGVRTLDEARNYIGYKFLESYRRNGFGMFLAKLRDGGETIGICGLVQRDFLEHPDIGFAFLPRFRGHGYAAEATEAVRHYARETLGLRRLFAITLPDNARSLRVLDRLGMAYQRMVDMDGEACQLLAVDL